MAVPLTHVVSRAVDDSYTRLHDLINELSGAGNSVTPEQRRQRLMGYVRQTRHQMLQLLAVSRWSHNAPQAERAEAAIAALGTRYGTCMQRG